MARSARTAVATVVFALSAALLTWAAWQWYSPPPAAKPPVPSTSSAPAVSPRPSPTAAPTSTAPTPEVAPPAITVTPTPTPSTTTPAPPAEPTEVTHLSVPSAGYDSDVLTMEIADSGVINPPDFVHSWWIRDRGVIPSSTATDTAYLACHTHSKKSAAVVPCNKVTLDNVPIGSTIDVTTDAEELTYTVIQARKVPRDEFPDDPDIWDINPGRLVWISCYLENGRYSDYNIVVIAELDS